MLFIHCVGCIYRSLRELCTTPQCASSCVAPRRKLTMACGRITNFPSCTARSLAIVPLDHDLWSNDKLSELCSSAAICATWSWNLITTRRYRAMKLTFALNNCTVLTKSEQMKRSNTTEALFSKVNQAAKAFFCFSASKYFNFTLPMLLFQI